MSIVNVSARSRAVLPISVANRPIQITETTATSRRIKTAPSALPPLADTDRCMMSEPSGPVELDTPRAAGSIAETIEESPSRAGDEVYGSCPARCKSPYAA